MTHAHISLSAVVLSACCLGCVDTSTGAGDSDWTASGESCGGETVVYLNRDGGAFRPGDDHAGENTSELLARPATAPPFPGDDEAWTQVMACASAVLSEYDITVTDVDPTGRQHMELVVTTVGPDLDLPYVYSAAPRSCEGNLDGLAFVFAGAHANRPTAVCMTLLGDVGHLVGLEHVTACDDVMAEAPDCDLASPTRRFRDTAAPCGMISEQDCECRPGRTQNSHRLMTERIGACGS